MTVLRFISIADGGAPRWDFVWLKNVACDHSGLNKLRLCNIKHFFGVPNCSSSLLLPLPISCFAEVKQLLLAKQWSSPRVVYQS